ncbi:MAG TPA: adenylyl-sulfate kinase [Chloroflexota bacterium]|jgi:adenylyl-sulfate kinase
MEEGFTLWFTGLSGAGKSTLAELVEQRLREWGRRVELLDGDEIRKNLSQGLGFSKADRDANILRIAFVARLLSRNGVVAITAAISPYRAIRDQARGEILRFVEVFVDCPLEVCEQRDVKGLYKKARSGEIKQFTGISDPYEPPENPEIHLHTELENQEQDVEIIFTRLRELGLMPVDPSYDDSAYTPEEEALVSERLKNLGYL